MTTTATAEQNVIVHHVEPSAGGPAPECVKLSSAECPGWFFGPVTSLDRSPELIWEWVQKTPVWSRLQPPQHDARHAELVSAGPADAWVCKDLCLAIGLPIVIEFQSPIVSRLPWNPEYIRTRIAVNEDGTRGAVVHSEHYVCEDESGDIREESYAFFASGGIPDVD